MKSKKSWVALALVHLLIVAVLGIALRSKILFSLPFIQFDYLRNAHSHFAFGGWITLALMLGLRYNLLPVFLHEKPVYQWSFRGLVFSSWGMLITFPFLGYTLFPIAFSTLFIFVTYFFGWFFIRDIFQADVNKTVRLLAVSSVSFLLLSSAGPFTLAYLLASRSHNFILLRDAVFSYLHFQYNGFFSLAVLALLFNFLQPLVSERQKKLISQFALCLVLSVIPSLFLSFLWHNPGTLIRIIAWSGSLLVAASAILFIVVTLPLIPRTKDIPPLVRRLGALSLCAFILKMILQSLTVFSVIGHAVFAIRPIIIGYLHLVFLVFVTLFLLAWFAQDGMLNLNKRMKRGLIVFASGAIFNEVLLMIQGFGILLTKSGPFFPLLLWVTSIWIFCGALLIILGQGKKVPAVR